MKEKLTIIKVGGKIVEEESTLNQLLADFSAIEGYKLLVHGGGRSATRLAAQLGIESKMVNGRRITDAETLKVVTMVYGGLVNKNIVAGLQAKGVNAIGLTGADMNVIRSVKRPVKDVDYGFKGVNCDDAVFSKGTKATGSIPAWTQLAFYSDPEKTPTGGEDAAAPFIRVSITYKAWEADPDPDPNSGIISKLEIKAVGPNSVLNSFSGILSFDMMVKDVETEEMYELNEGWQKVEYDFQVGTPDGNPFAFTIGFNGATFDTGALLIKEIKFTSPTDGAYAKGKAANFMKYLTLENGQIVTGINTPTFEGNKVRCNVSNNLLTISNLESGDKVEVYSILGTLISSQKATSDVLALPLNGKGVFIVKTKTTTTKVVNN